MAGITSGARLPEPEEFDYSVSHREVPTPKQSGQYSRRPQEEEGTGEYSTRRRRGSLDKLLHRSTSHRTASDAPPVPNTRIAQAHAQAAVANREIEHLLHTAGSSNGNLHTRYNSSSAATTTSPTSPDRKNGNSNSGNTMLRKLSSGRHEQDRQAREAAITQQQQQRQQAQTPRQAPRLPSINDFHDDARPDSLAIFNNQYGSHSATPPAATPTANFSRPGAVAANMPSSSNYSGSNASSSPAYAYQARPGNAFAQQQAAVSSSSPAVKSEGASSIGREESMAHRGRYSYASSHAVGQQPASVNSPRRVRRRKDPTPFNILVVGAKNSGKTSFISFLRHSLAIPSTTQSPSPATTTSKSSTSFTSTYLETSLDSEPVGLTLWDSAGLEKHIIDLQLREMASFVESKFEETFVEEQKVNRSPGVKDTHIHCVLLVLDPVKLDGNIAKAGVSQEGLDDELDLQVLRALWGKTTVIPVVSKADTLTVGHMAFLKRAVWGSLKSAKLDPLEALELDDDDEEEEVDEDGDDDVLAETDEEGEDGAVNSSEGDSSSDYESSSSPAPKAKRGNGNTGHNRQSSLAGAAAVTNGSGSSADDTPYIPMSILSPDIYDLPPHTTKTGGNGKVGRHFPWGFADPLDPSHCDFVRLRDSIFSEWRGDLRDLARTKWYENWRTSRLKNLPGHGKSRVKGGITPTVAVPKEGRSAGREVPVVVAASSVPRSVSGGSMSTAMSGGYTGAGAGTGGGASAEQRSTSKAERMMGISAVDATQAVPMGGSQSGTYRSINSYQ